MLEHLPLGAALTWWASFAADPNPDPRAAEINPGPDIEPCEHCGETPCSDLEPEPTQDNEPQ